MLKKTCLTVTLLSLLNMFPAQGQEFYSSDRPASSRITSVSFGTNNQGDESDDKGSVVDLEVADGCASR